MLCEKETVSPFVSPQKERGQDAYLMILFAATRFNLNGENQHDILNNGRRGHIPNTSTLGTVNQRSIAFDINQGKPDESCAHLIKKTLGPPACLNLARVASLIALSILPSKRRLRIPCRENSFSMRSSMDVPTSNEPGQFKDKEKKKQHREVSNHLHCE